MIAMPAPRGQRGYTLLEVLIAFTLLAIGLGLLLSILSSGLHAVANASASTRATLYAESVFDTLGADRRLQLGHTQGAFENGHYHWTLDITPFQPPLPTPPAGQGDPSIVAQAQQGVADNVMVRVVLQIHWGTAAGQALQVETLRAYSPPPAGLQQ